MATTIKKNSDIYLNPQIKSPLIGNGGNSTNTMVQTEGGGGTSTGSSNAAPTPTTDPSSVYMDEIQKATVEKNYKTLLKSDIAAYNLKMNTQKYLNNSLAAQGVGTQGYGTSAHIGAENNASQLYAENQENFNDAEATAASEAQTRADTAGTENDNQLVTYLQYSDGSDEQIAEYMKSYGYTQQSDGTWKDSNGNQPSSYVKSAIYSAKNGSSSSSSTVKVDSTSSTAYDGSKYGTDQMADNGVGFVNAYKSSYDGVSSDGYTTENVKSLTVGNKDNTSTDTLKNIVGDEVQLMINYVKDGKASDGTLFRLQRGSGYGEAYLVMYVNGKFYLCSDDDREQDGNQVSNRYNQYTGSKVYFKGSKQV